MSERKIFFEENGYCLAKGVFSSEEISALEEDFGRIVRQLESGEDDRPRVKGNIYTQNPHQYSSRWMTAMLQEAFLDVVEELIGPDIVLSHSNLSEKRKSNNLSSIEMHQDWSYMATRENTLISGMIHLSQATEEMGCIRFYPGSHRRGRMVQSSRADANFQDRYPIEGATPIEAEPGDVTLFHYFIVHGSTPNFTEKPRKTVLARMFSGRDRREDITELNENLVLRGFNYHTTFGSAQKGVLKAREGSK